MSLLRASIHRMLPRLLGLQLLGNLLLLGLSSLWLLIPDSHVWQLILSLVFGILLVISFLEQHAYTLRNLRQPAEPLRLWRSALVLFAWLLLFYLASLALSHWSVHIDDRAGFWNSRLSPSLRRVWTYERLQQWQQQAAALALWVLLPALLLPWIIETVSCGPSAASWRRGLRVLARWQHWLAAIVLCEAILQLTPRLVDWHPYDSVHGEIGSALFRLPLVCVVDVFLALLLCSIDAGLLQRQDIGGNAGAQPHP